MKKTTSNRMVWLLVGIPAASVVMGVVTLILATSRIETPVAIDESPLSKTSWSDD